MSTSDYSFITDRLAIGNVASRATPGFCAVVSILATDRPGVGVDQLAHAPPLPREFLRDRQNACLHIDLADNEDRKTMLSVANAAHSLTDYLDDATSFIAAHLRRGCVLVHCGAGKSRSVAVVIAYLCRYAGMSFVEAAAFVAERRPGACPAPCFAEAIKRWLRLDELATKGPRR